MRTASPIQYQSAFSLKRNVSDFERVKITSSIIADEVVKKFYSDDIEIFESVFILLLNNSNETIGFAKISQGGIVGTVVDIRLIAKYCIDSLATGCIMAHNHPSGKLKPSQADLDITKKVKEGLKLLDVLLLDHIIVTAEGYYSMGDNGDI